MVQKEPVTPFFSIITCTKNSAKYLPTCLASVKAQTFRDFEHLIVDGDSTDGTRALLPRSSRVFSLPPRGISAAMNTGIKHARGEYLYFLHSDDSLYDPTVLQQVHDFLLTHRALDWAYGRIHETNGKKTIGYPPRLSIFQGYHPNLLKFYNYIPHQGSFVKKSVFDQFGTFDEKLKSMMDPEFWLRIAPRTHWGYMPIVVANYLIHPSSQSENPAHRAGNTREYEAVQRKYLSGPELALATLINRILR